MSEPFISKRALFESGAQKKFIEQLQAVLTTATLARTAECSERTIRLWRSETHLIPEATVRRLARAANRPVPRHRIIDARKRASRAGALGGAALIKKYGKVPVRESYRKERWNRWWEERGRQTLPIAFKPMKIRKPRMSRKLAEFIGIMMGDGGMSDRQTRISLNSRDDMAYAIFVSNLMRRLFGVVPAIYKDKKDAVNDLVVSRTQLVKYLHGLGLPIGNKIRQKLDLPDWVKENRSYEIACIRGLVDTDGCIFTHRYRVNGKEYAYKKLSFTSASPALVATVGSALRRLGLTPRIAREGRDVRLDSIQDVKRYFQIVGTHNPKHLKRYKNRVG